MNPETREHLDLNPDLQRPLYHSPGGPRLGTKQPGIIERMKQLQEAFPEYEQREKEYKEYLKTKSEYK